VLQKCYMGRKTDKTCVVCGEVFKGTAGRITCSGACRTALHRILKIGKKPDYWLIAKSKGQKMPLLFAGPRPKMKEAELPLSSEIKYSPNTDASFNGPKISRYVMDEVGLTKIAEPLTKEQKESKKREIEALIAKTKKEECPMGKHPKMFVLAQEVKISELEEQLEFYK